jgi:hypothetical protein
VRFRVLRNGIEEYSEIVLDKAGGSWDATTLVADIAQRWTISEDGTTITQEVFYNGTLVFTEDVVATVSLKGDVFTSFSGGTFREGGTSNYLRCGLRNITDGVTLGA